MFRTYESKRAERMRSAKSWPQVAGAAKYYRVALGALLAELAPLEEHADVCAALCEELSKLDEIANAAKAVSE